MRDRTMLKMRPAKANTRANGPAQEQKIAAQEEVK